MYPLEAEQLIIVDAFENLDSALLHVPPHGLVDLHETHDRLFMYPDTRLCTTGKCSLEATLDWWEKMSVTFDS